MRPCLSEDGTEHLRSEQKPVLLSRELIYRFSVAQDVVVDLFSGTYTTAAACLSMPDGCYRRFIGFERDKACHDQAQCRISVLTEVILLRCYREPVVQGAF
jgi:DNA modification methylase